MKANVFTIVAMLAIFGVFAAACAPNNGTPASATPTATIPAPTATATLPPVISPEWELPAPRDANQLPTELNPAIVYVQPPENCAERNDPNRTCSTIKGQVTDGDFVLKSGQALVMTGDAINIYDDGDVLVDQPSLDTVHDLWVVVNTTDAGIRLRMYAPHGSFRGYFEPTDGNWNIQKIAHLRDLHLYLFLLPEQTYDRFTPTPVPNCESRYGCEVVNVRIVVFDDTGMHVAGYGLYLENQPFWQDLLQLLGQ